MATVAFEHVIKIYPDGTEAVHDLNLVIGDGELIVFVGPSGCGKTTALRMVAGLEDITGGVIRIGDRIINGVECGDRDIAMVFQNYALYPHMSVYDNIAFPLKLNRVPKPQRDEKVRRVSRTLGLEVYLDRKPRHLSGGQRQRVAMGRAIVREPQAFLMDEPLSNLDAKLRVQVRAEISALQKDLGVTTIYVTHDQVEALTMGDRVAVMRRGYLQQVSDSQTLYDRPSNLFVAGFIGSPPMNLVEGEIVRSEMGLAVAIGEQRLTLDPMELAEQVELQGCLGRRIVVGVRPERLEDASLVGDALPTRRLKGVATLRESVGSDALVHFVVMGSRPLSTAVRALAHDVEDPAELEALEREQGGVTFVGRFAPRTVLRSGSAVEVAVPPGALHFFDIETGCARGAAP